MNGLGGAVTTPLIAVSSSSFRSKPLLYTTIFRSTFFWRLISFNVCFNSTLDIPLGLYRTKKLLLRSSGSTAAEPPLFDNNRGLVTWQFPTPSLGVAMARLELPRGTTPSSVWRESFTT